MMMLSTEYKQILKRILAGTLRATRWIYGVRIVSSTVILNYHSIHPVHKFATKPDDFTKQMEYMAVNFKLISLHDLYEMRTTKKDISGRFAVITFDDGYEDNYDYAFPILKYFGVNATFFLTTGFLNGEVDIAKRDIIYRGLKPLKWEQILQMKAEGLSFGSHTHTHPILSDISLNDAENEIICSKDILENRLNETIKMFAYPLGQRRTFNSSIVKLLKKHGFESACSTVWGCDNSCTDIFGLHRIRIDPFDTLNDFKDKVNGNWEFIRWIQRLR